MRSSTQGGKQMNIPVGIVDEQGRINKMIISDKMLGGISREVTDGRDHTRPHAG